MDTTTTVRKRAEEAVACVRPHVVAAAESEEAGALRNAAFEVYQAGVACVLALWSFCEPELAALVNGGASKMRARCDAAAGFEAFVYRAFASIWCMAEAAAANGAAQADAHGGAPKIAVDKARAARAWVVRVAHNEVEGKQRAKEALAKPGETLRAAAESDESVRLRTAGYAVLLALVACCIALFGAFIPIAAGAVACVASAVSRRRGTAAGYEAYFLFVLSNAWFGFERFVSKFLQFANAYEGPGGLTLLQMATALSWLVEWLNESAKAEEKVDLDEDVGSGEIVDRVCTPMGESSVAKAEVVVAEVAAMDLLKKEDALVNVTESHVVSAPVDATPEALEESGPAAVNE